MVHSVAKSYRTQHVGGAVEAFLFADSGVHEWQGDIVQGCLARNQIKRLKHKSNFLVADRSKFGLSHSADVASGKHVGSGSWSIKAAQNVHQRRLA